MPDYPPENGDSPFASMRGHHVALRVPDYEAAKAWYTEKLDFRVLQEWAFAGMELAYLVTPVDNGFHIELLGGGDPEMPAVLKTFDEVIANLNVGGYHHFCMRVDDLDGTLATLRARGVTTLGEPFELDEISSRLAFFTDPWGTKIELSEDLR